MYYYYCKQIEVSLHSPTVFHNEKSAVVLTVILFDISTIIIPDISLATVYDVSSVMLLDIPSTVRVVPQQTEDGPGLYTVKLYKN